MRMMKLVNNLSSLVDPMPSDAVHHVAITPDTVEVSVRSDAPESHASFTIHSPAELSRLTSLKAKPFRQIKSITGIEEEERYLYDWPELGTVFPGEPILQRLRSDVRGVHDRYPQAVYQRNQSRPPHSAFIDDWGIGQEEYEGGSGSPACTRWWMRRP